MGTFDGPGLRLVVFLQGCNFRCLYCANPDTIAGKGGTPTPPEEIVRMAMSQRPFFGKRGGVTFSGGEPTFQAKALVPLVRELKEKGMHVCIDSNGGIWNEEVEELSTAKKEAAHWGQKYHELWYEVKPYLDALHRAPELVHSFLEKILAPKQERTMNVPQRNRTRGQDMEL